MKSTLESVSNNAIALFVGPDPPDANNPEHLQGDEISHPALDETPVLQLSQLASGTVTVPEFIPPTGFDAIDGLLEDRKWSESTISFSFPDSFVSDYAADYPRYDNIAASFGQATPGLQSVVRWWLSEIAGVTNLTFVEFDGPEGSETEDAQALMRIAMSNDPVSAYAYTPWDSDEAADVWFNKDTFGAWFDQAQMGEYVWHTIGHEISHALGFKHGHEGGGVAGVALPPNLDSMEFTIMTYRSYENHVVNGTYANAYGNYAQTLMQLDIQAYQSLYGANYDTYSGDTLYSFSDSTGDFFIDGQSQGQPILNTIFRTIWDGNGNDTYSFANYSTPLLIDLNPGGYVDLDKSGNHQRALLGESEQIYARGHIFNSLLFNDDPRSLIENAIGGTGDDDLRGNIANNRLEGGRGNDQIAGGDGFDILLDGPGEDLLTGGSDGDRFSLDADGQRDRITDFTVGLDELDLSAWGISDLSQLQLTVHPDKLELTFESEILELDNVAADTFDVAAIIGIPSAGSEGDINDPDPSDGDDGTNDGPVSPNPADEPDDPVDSPENPVDVDPDIPDTVDTGTPDGSEGGGADPVVNDDPVGPNPTDEPDGSLENPIDVKPEVSDDADSDTPDESDLSGEGPVVDEVPITPNPVDEPDDSLENPIDVNPEVSDSVDSDTPDGSDLSGEGPIVDEAPVSPDLTNEPNGPDETTDSPENPVDVNPDGSDGSELSDADPVTNEEPINQAPIDGPDELVDGSTIQSDAALDTSDHVAPDVNVPEESEFSAKDNVTDENLKNPNPIYEPGEAVDSPEYPGSGVETELGDNLSDDVGNTIDGSEQSAIDVTDTDVIAVDTAITDTTVSDALTTDPAPDTNIAVMDLTLTDTLITSSVTTVDTDTPAVDPISVDTPIASPVTTVDTDIPAMDTPAIEAPTTVSGIAVAPDSLTADSTSVDTSVTNPSMFAMDSTSVDELTTSLITAVDPDTSAIGPIDVETSIELATPVGPATLVVDLVTTETPTINSSISTETDTPVMSSSYPDMPISPVTLTTDTFTALSSDIQDRVSLTNDRNGKPNDSDYVGAEIGPVEYGNTSGADSDDSNQSIATINIQTPRPTWTFLDLQALLVETKQKTRTLKSEQLPSVIKTEKLVGPSDNDFIFAQGEEEGFGGSDDLSGGAENDRIRGDNGNDIVVGDGGNNLFKDTTHLEQATGNYDIYSRSPGNESLVLSRKADDDYDVEYDAEDDKRSVLFVDAMPGQDMATPHLTQEFGPVGDGSRALPWFHMNGNHSSAWVASFGDMFNLNSESNSFRSG
ncbi:MAG: M10 family metallopeptidase C-terminal domain-containing protein [Cyanobacteria bacterium P01_F01_bin.150]